MTPQMSNLMIDVGPGGRLDLQVEDEVAILLLCPEVFVVVLLTIASALQRDDGVLRRVQSMLPG
jgi:putative component of toxin-antitoxin plasmid stabilization module